MLQNHEDFYGYVIEIKANSVVLHDMQVHEFVVQKFHLVARLWMNGALTLLRLYDLTAQTRLLPVPFYP